MPPRRGNRQLGFAGREPGGRNRGGRDAGEGQRGGRHAPGGELGGNILPPNLPTPLPADREYSARVRIPTYTEGYDVREMWIDEYPEAIETLRTTASSGNLFYEDNNEIYRLPLPTDAIPDDFTLALHNSDNRWLVFYFACKDLYLKGFENENENGIFRLSDADWTRGRDLGFNGTYIDLGRVGGRSLSGLEMGVPKLQDVVRDLSLISINEDNGQIEGNYQAIASGIMCMVVMFSEAARFEFLSELFVQCNYVNTRLLENQETYLNNWAKLSKFMIAAAVRTNRIANVNALIEGMRLPQIDGRPVQSVEDLRFVIRVVSGQTVAVSLALIGVANDEVNEEALLGEANDEEENEDD